MINKQIITRDIKIPNKEMEVLRKHFSHCFDKNGDFQIEKFKQSISENEISFSKESYSMDWLGKSYARLLASDPATTLLKEDKEHNQKPENKEAENLLLKGDNLEVLKHLTNAYYEKIKMIYIDPPYNTGKDAFVYQDDRKFTVDELRELAGLDKERAQRILDFTQSKSNSHSAWLTFMYPRLYIAKQLLKEDGVIFISIDDNEVAQLKLMMDEIFGEENFAGIFPWKKRTAKSDVPFGISQDYEWMLAFAQPSLYAGLPIYRKYHKSKDYPNDKWRLSDLTTQRMDTERPNSAFDMKDPKTKKVYSYNPKRVWSVTRDTFKKYYDSGKIVFPDDYSFLNIRIPAYRVFESEDKAKALQKYGSETPIKAASTSFPKTIGRNEDGNKEIVELFEQKIFSFPKPTALIRHLVEISNDKNSIVLDFFAGSGTTGDAVMQLNAEDGGNRKYILVQLPETIDKKDKAAYDFVTKELKAEPTIFEITKERLLRAAKKINQELDEKNKDLEAKINSLKAELPTEETKEEIEALKEEIQVNNQVKAQNNFKVFETMPIWEDYHFEAKELDEQLQLFDEAQLTEEDLQALLITWKTYDGIPLTEDLKEIDLSGYKAYYANNKLYLMDKGFTIDGLKALLERIDSDKFFNPTSIIVFGYHFESKSLRELAENLKSYSNKKNIDIDFITRY